MQKTMLVAWREFLETVRTKAFVLGAIAMPILMIGLIFATDKIMKVGKKEKQPLRKIAVVDETGGSILEILKVAGAQYSEGNPNRPIEFVVAEDAEAITDIVRDGTVYASLRIPADAIDPAGKEKAELIRESDKLSEAREIGGMLDDAVTRYRFARHDPPLDFEEISKLRRSIDVDTVNVRTGERGKARDFTRIMMPFAFMFLLWMGTFGISQGLLTSVIEEKSSRVVEVLLSAVSPMQLMGGKIIGMVMVGVLLIGVWLTVGYFAMDSMGNAAALSGSRVSLFIAYYIPSFLLYAALLAGIGAAFNTLKEAQAMITPFTLITVIPMMLWFFISDNPQSIISVVASFVVPITPFIMILRICADSATPMWQIWATIILLWVSALASMWVAAKIFRVGVLMYGKAPTPGEMIRWMRYS